MKDLCLLGIVRVTEHLIVRRRVRPFDDVEELRDSLYFIVFSGLSFVLAVEHAMIE